MKKILSLCLFALCLLTSTLPAFASDLSIVTEETLLHGITYKRIQALYENGWQDIHVIQADLNLPHLKFDVLSHNDGKSFRENTYTSAVNADALAAVNADFFVSKKDMANRGSAIGLEIKNGEMLTSPAAYENMNALYQEKNRDVLSFSPFSFNFTIKAPNGQTAPITVINKYDDMRGIVMYTRAWNELSDGSAGNILELVVENGVVTAKNMNVGPVPIPENGYILTCDIGMNTFLKDCFEVGSSVTLSMLTTPSYENIQTAVGGGGMVLVNGKIPSKYSHTIAGTHPRSAVGLDATGKIMTLVAVDGRRNEAAGMTMVQLGYLMAELGCYNAMNLDGGGSTLMTAKQTDGSQKVLNVPSDGSKRAVTNSVGVMLETTETPDVAAIRLKTDDKTVFAGTSLWCYVETLDQYGRVIGTVPSADIHWTIIEGEGTMETDYFHPTSSGKATIKAEAFGCVDMVTVEVLSSPRALSFTQKKYTATSGEKTLLWLKATDQSGRSASVYLKDALITVDDPAIARIEQNSVVGLKQGATLIKATLGEISAFAAVCVDGAEEISVPNGKTLTDIQEKSAPIAKDGFRFTVFGNTRTPAQFFDIYIMNGVINNLKKESNMNYFVGNGVNKNLLTDLGSAAITAGSFTKTTKNNNTFITLKNAYGTMLYNEDSTQWEQLKKAVDALQGGNLFVFLNDHNLSSSQTEIAVFKKLMTEAAKKCANVYVFAGGFVNETVIENGVRYITTAGVFPSIGAKPPATNVSYLKYYLVTVNGNEVTYETKGILKNK